MGSLPQHTSSHMNPDTGPASHTKCKPMDTVINTLPAAESRRSYSQQEWKRGQNLLNEFWRIWSQDYLNTLRERSKYGHQGRTGCRTPKAGKVILLQEKGMSRGSWRIAKITELHKSSDGAIRCCDIQLPSEKVVRRPVGMLIPSGSQLDRRRGARKIAGTTKQHPALDKSGPIRSQVPPRKCRPWIYH